MSNERFLRLAFAAFASTFLLSLLAAFMIPGGPIGLGGALLTAIAVGSVFWLSRQAAVRLTPGLGWLAVPALGFAAMLAWRDSVWIKAANLSMLFLIGGYAMLRAHRGSLWQAELREVLEGILSRWAHTLVNFGPILDLQGRWRVWRGQIDPRGRGKAYWVGFWLAVPFLIVFMGLFQLTDPSFARWLTPRFEFDPLDMGQRVIAFAIFFVLFGGWVQTVLLQLSASAPIGPPRPPLLGVTEVTTALGLINVLFFTFVVRQGQYLFGGEAAVRDIAGLTLAQYARGGFFELVIVSALSLGLLLAAHSALSAADRRNSHWFPAMATVQVALVGAMMASAIQRLSLYVARTGISELRIYALSGMVLIALVLTWFLVTLYQRRERSFAPGAAVALAAVVTVLNFVNPDGLIARINLSRPGVVDMEYLSTLSQDAVPAMVAAAQRSPAIPGLAEELRRRAELRDSGDWRSWSVSRQKASTALENRRRVSQR